MDAGGASPILPSTMNVPGTAKGTTRVLVADDHAVVRAGVRALIGDEPDLAVVSVAADAAQTLAEAERLRPDVVVLDLAMPGARGASLVTQLRRRVPDARIVVLSMHATASHVRDALGRGATGFVSKESADEELIEAVRAVAAGRGYVGAALGARLAEDDDPLSAREREVATLLARGFTNQEIASRLGISVRTTEAHRSHAMAKLGLSTRAELVDYALERGILVPDGDEG